MNYKLYRILRPFYRIFQLILKLNLLKTLYINFRKLPINQAIKLPIYVYYGVSLASLKGRIILKNCKTGIVRIGYNIDGVPLSYLRTVILIKGDLIIYGYLILGKGSIINVYGQLEFGECCTVGGGTFIKSMDRIHIGKYTQITYGCTVFDSNMHYVKDIDTGIVRRKTAPITIGCNCWINANTTISKGSVLPDYTITARNSVINKDYSELGINLFLVGSPAVALEKRVQRIFSISEEKRLNIIFQDTSINKVECSIGIFDDCDYKSFFERL